jgi:hypothetical protein
MSEYAGKYVVMIDDWVDAFPQHWPITIVRTRLRLRRAWGIFTTILNWNRVARSVRSFA